MLGRLGGSTLLPPHGLFFSRAIVSLQAGTCLTSSTSGVAVSAETSGEAVRGESEPALILAIFLFPAQKWQKKTAIQFLSEVITLAAKISHKNI